MKPLNIIAQKTVVLSERKSRNSFRPLLEESGFNLDFKKYSRELLVFDGKEKVARILGVKGNTDFKELAYSLDFKGAIMGTDMEYILYPKFSYNSSEIDFSDEVIKIYPPTKEYENYIKFGGSTPLLSTQVGECRLKMISTKSQIGDFFEIDDYDTLYTKYPEKLILLLQDYYQYRIQPGILIENPENTTYKKSQALLDQIFKKIRYSDSPDTMISEMKGLNPDNEYAGWEIVETGNSIKNLGLLDLEIDSMNKKISTNLYSNLEELGDEEGKTMIYFKDKVQATIKKNSL